MIARLLAVILGCALGMGVFGVGEVIVKTGNNPFEDGRLPPDGVTALSWPSAIEPASLSRPYGLQSTIAKEK